MGVTAALEAARVVANTRRILAIEAIAACQALEFLKPLETSAALKAAYRRLREEVPPYDTGPGDGARDRGVAALVSEGRDPRRRSVAVCGTLE